MTSVLVPPVDLAPGMPSRVVTISATDVTEGGTSMAGQMVRFALSDTLDVTSGGDVIAKTQAEVVLDADGNGSIRLPVYNPAVKTWCGDEDWAVLVTATWGSQKAIRVPAGTTSIALSALPPVRALRGREKQWAITGVSASVTEGGSWGVTVGLNGGVLDFDFTVPPGGTAWKRGLLATGTDANSLTGTAQSGIYALGSSAVYTNMPFTGAGQLEVAIESSGPGYQEATQYATGFTYKRPLTNPYSSPKQWGAWRRTDADFQGNIERGSDLNVFDRTSHNGGYALLSDGGYANAPFTGPGQLTVSVVGTGPGYQEAVEYATAATYRRPLTDPYATPRKWGPWRRTDVTLPTSTGAIPRLPDPGAPLEADTSLVTMWGDSLTHAGGIAARLGALLPGVAVVNRGQSGQHSAQIAARQGGWASVMTVVGGEIPASGPVTIDQYTAGVLIESGYPARSLTGYLAGVHGTLSVPSGSVVYTFTRTTPGVAIPIPDGAPFWTDHGIEARRGAQILWVGRNNLAEQLPTKYIPEMIGHLSPARKRVAVLSVTNRPDEGIGTDRYTLFQTVNEQLRIMAGECFLDVRRFLIDEGLAAVGITPTSEDSAAVASDAVPPSLTTDGTHFTNAAQATIGTWLYTQLDLLGWWA